MAHGAASAVVQHGQHHGCAFALDAGRVQGQAIGTGGVFLHEGVHVTGIAGVQAGQGVHGGALARALAVAEAHAAGVQHEGVQQVQVAPAGLGGALAEVVFLTVALPEILRVEQADSIQAVAADVHAKAHAGGYVHHGAGVGACGQCIQARRVPPRGQGVVFTKARVTADGGVGGQGRDAGHARVAVGGGADAVQPVVGHFGVAVEQQHVVGLRQRHAPVDGADEAEVFLVLQQGDAVVLRGTLAQPGGDLGLGAAIVDDDEAPGRLHRRRQHGFDAQARVIQAAVDGNDDVHGVPRRLHGLGCGPRGGAQVLWGAAQQAVEGHLGMHQRAGGAEYGGVLDGLEVGGELAVVALQARQLVLQPRGVSLQLRRFVLEAGALPVQLRIGCLHLLQRVRQLAQLVLLLGIALRQLAYMVLQRQDGRRQRQVVGRHGPADVHLQHRGRRQLLRGGGQFEPRIVPGEQQHRG